MTAQEQNELRELLTALKWLGGAILIGIAFTFPFWAPAAWINF